MGAIEAAAYRTIYDLDGIDELAFGRQETGVILDLRGGTNLPSTVGTVDSQSFSEFHWHPNYQMPWVKSKKDNNSAVNNIAQDGYLNSAGLFSESIIPRSTTNDSNLFIYYLNEEDLVDSLEVRTQIYDSRAGDTHTPSSISDFQIAEGDRESNSLIDIYGLEHNKSENINKSVRNELKEYLNSDFAIEIGIGSQGNDILSTHGDIWEFNNGTAGRISNDVKEFSTGLISGGSGSNELNLRGPWDIAIGGNDKDKIKIFNPPSNSLLRAQSQTDPKQLNVGQIALGFNGDDEYVIEDLGRSYHTILLEGVNQLFNSNSSSVDFYGRNVDFNEFVTSQTTELIWQELDSERFNKY